MSSGAGRKSILVPGLTEGARREVERTASWIQLFGRRVEMKRAIPTLSTPMADGR